MNSNDMAALAITAVITVAITTVLLARMKYRAIRPPASADLKAIEERLARMEQAIDAMAVETERISEGQRFTTKLLSERAKDPAAH